ncbi:MAG TPA: hypothetical protein VL899_11400 [Alphaproteobacteria bacterium]|jgi:hypothetical protein|nr:hypothetical protein [Alphaproteobacteria bacterium]
MSINVRLSPALFGGVLLVLFYVASYLGDLAQPAPLEQCCAGGWANWWDQSLFYHSMDALAEGKLDARLHMVPPGYSLLAVPFAFLRGHAFFPVDLISLTTAYAAFVCFAVRAGVSATVAAALFLLTACADPIVFRQWVIPWSTTPSAALTWVLLALSAAHLQGKRRPFILGVVAAAMPILRPTDALISATCVAWLTVSDFRQSALDWRAVARLAAGAALILLPYAALYLAIYGLGVSWYIRKVGQVGFTFHNPIWRAYVLLIEPRQWFFIGKGLLAQMPWLIFGIAGLVLAFVRGGAIALLSACLIIYCSLYLCYMDLLPTGLWRYFNIHYFMWTFPAFGLLGWLLIKALFAGQRLACAALAVTLLLSCVRVTPRLAGPREMANAIDLPGPTTTEANTTMSEGLAIVDDKGPVANISNMRAFPMPLGQGVRFIGLRRNFAGAVTWLPGQGLPMSLDPAPQVRWAEHIGFGYPCWLPPLACKHPVLPPG